MKLGIYTPYPSTFPSPRFRVYQFLPYLEAAGIRCTVFHALPGTGRFAYSTGAGKGRRALRHVYEWTATLGHIRAASRFDVVLVQKGITPSRFRGLARSLVRRSKRIIYDIDDAVHLEPESRFPGLLARLQEPRETALLIEAADLVFCGNRLLDDDISSRNEHRVIVPTTVECARFRPIIEEKPRESTPVVVWSGSDSTNEHLRPLLPVVSELARRGLFRLRVSSNSMRLLDAGLFPPGTIEFRRWSPETEVDDIASADVGIMPMPDDEWSRRKCGFKALACMACGLPVVASPVGVNRDIVRPGENGFAAESDDEWRKALSALCGDRRLRETLGARARETVLKAYSTAAVFPTVERSLRSLIALAARQDRGENR